MAQDNKHSFASSRLIRNGFMGFVVRMANLVKKIAEFDNLSEMVPEQLKSQDWLTFVNTELENSNRENQKNLAG
jgi:SIT4 phosphatase-associated protein